MRLNYINIFVVFIFITALISCEKDEIKSVDPMVNGLIDNIEVEINAIMTSDGWSSSLLNLRDQRLRLAGIKGFMEKGGYSKDGYTLTNKEQVAENIETTLMKVESIIDSVWRVNVHKEWNSIDENSLGIQYFGSNKYARMDVLISEVYDWIMADSLANEELWIADDLEVLKEDVGDLKELSAMNEEEVAQYVEEVETKYFEMEQQYMDLASEVENSGFFSKAQKDLYVSLNGPLSQMGDKIEEGNLSLDTKDALNDIDRDLYSLVYFVNNNYTSPPQKPRVYGEISSITELRWFSEKATLDDWNNTWVLTSDIDAAETHRWNPDAAERGFQQIDGPVSIHFDGQYHFISGLLLTNTGGPDINSGFFKNVQNGSIRNVGFINTTLVNGVNAQAGGQGGVVAGWLTNVEVSKVFAHGTMEITIQSGSFLGRPQVGVKVSDCFSSVDCVNPKDPGWTHYSSSFIGLPVLDFSMKNVYNTGKTLDKVFFGYPHSISLTASGVYYDSESVGSTDLEYIDNAGAFYMDGSPNTLTEVAVDLPSEQWNDLANFPEFSSDVWEIRTVKTVDSKPRPYLKGFNYDILDEFLIPE